MTDGYGTVITARSDDRLRVLHADPRIRISGELLHLIARWPSKDAWIEPAGNGTVGSLLKIRDEDGLLIYRITDQHFDDVRPYWTAEWPD